MKPALVIAGLGNPGANYEHTRHNAGFLALDAISREYGQGEWKEIPKFSCVAQEARIVTAPVLLMKPQTFMNRSGEPIRKVIDFFKLDPAKNLIVLTDDIDIPLAQLRLRMKGGPGTHNGMKSVVQTLGEEVARIRIGLGAPNEKQDLAAWVLSRMTQEENGALEKAFESLPQMLHQFVMEAPSSTQS